MLPRPHACAACASDEQEAAIRGAVPLNATLVFTDEAAESGALARWVPLDVETTGVEEGTRDLPPTVAAREMSASAPLRATPGGMSPAPRPATQGGMSPAAAAGSASQMRLQEETLKMQAAFHAATAPYLSAQQSAAASYALRASDEAGAAERAAEPEAVRRARERRQVLEETLAELPAGSESRAQVEQMLALLPVEQPPAPPAAAGPVFEPAALRALPATVDPVSANGHGATRAIAPTVDPMYTNGTNGTGDRRLSGTYHAHYQQHHGDLHDTTILSNGGLGEGPEQFPFQLLFGDGMATVDPNAFIVDGSPGAHGQDELHLDAVRVDRGLAAKGARPVGGKASRMLNLKKKKERLQPPWPALDETDDEDGDKHKKPVAQGRSALVEAELVVGGSREGSGNNTPGRTTTGDLQAGADVHERPTHFFSRINVPLPSMHHTELYGANGDPTEEEMAVGGHHLAPEQLQNRYHGPGLLVVEDSANEGGSRTSNFNT